MTPGINLELDQLAAKESHYLAAIVESDPGRLALALLDASTGELIGTELGHRSALVDELVRLRPRELLVADDSPLLPSLQTLGVFVNTCEPGYFDLDRHAASLAEVPAFATLEVELPLGLRRAVSGCLAYLRETQPAALSGVRAFARYRVEEFLRLEQNTWRNLEIERTILDGKRKGALLGLLDETCTAMGGRLLRRYLSHPRLQPEAIDERLQLVEIFRQHNGLRAELRRRLVNVYDIERLAGRLASGLINPREMVSLRRSLAELPNRAYPGIILLGVFISTACAVLGALRGGENYIVRAM